MLWIIVTVIGSGLAAGGGYLLGVHRSRAELLSDGLVWSGFDLERVRDAGQRAELAIAEEQRDRRWRAQASHALGEATDEYPLVVPSTWDTTGELALVGA